MTATGVCSAPTPSPEQVRQGGRRRQRPRSALAFHLVGGRPPFSGDNAIAVGFAHCAEPVPSLKALRPDVPPALEAIITRALAKAPADRPRSPAEFKAALTA
jgi:serine/threonine-protein kinase